MSWRISEKEFLIRGRSYPLYLSLSVNRVKLPDGSLIDSTHEYFRVSAEADVLEWYRGPWTSTLEECLYVTDMHFVLQTSLYKFFWTECYGRAPGLQQTICLRDLEPIVEEVLPFDPMYVVEEFHLMTYGGSS